MTQMREICTRDTDPGRGQAAPRSQCSWRLGVGGGRGFQGLLHRGLPGAGVHSPISGERGPGTVRTGGKLHAQSFALGGSLGHSWEMRQRR